MFDSLRNAFSSAAKSFSEKELKEKDIDEILSQLEISLLESDVAIEVIDSIKSDLKEKLIGTKVDKKEIEAFVKNSLIQSISSLFDSVGKIDIKSKISDKKNSGEPYLILFVGINGTGKTTTLAKLAYLLMNSKFSIVVAAADTTAIEKDRDSTINYIESRIKEMEVALKDNAAQKQQVVTSLEQGKQEMKSISEAIKHNVDLYCF